MTWAHCSCPSGEHDPAVTCQNAKGLIDRPVLNCVFELISTVRPHYKGWGCPQSLFFSVVLLILSTRHSTQQPRGNVKMEWWCIFSKAFKSCGCPWTDWADLILCTCTCKPFRSVEQTYLRFVHAWSDIHVLTHTKYSSPKVSLGAFFRPTVIPVSIIAQCWELNISQVHPLLFSHLSHQTVMLNFGFRKISRALL